MPSSQSSAGPARGSPAGIDERIARRVGELRAELGHSLETLAGRSGVSRAMISRIERGEVSATAVVLNKLAIGLGVPLPTLFGYAVRGPGRPMHPVTRRSEQALWRDAHSGYQRRTLSPPGLVSPLQLSEAVFPPGARMTFENSFGPRAPHQQIWMLKGELHLRREDAVRRLTAGDCMAMTLDQPVIFHNTGGSIARCLVALAHAAPP